MVSVLRRPLGSAWVLLAVVALAPARALAQTTDENTDRIPGIPDTSIADVLPEPLADPGGVRSALKKRGVFFNLNYIGEVLSNPVGGVRQGTLYDGRFEFAVAADLQKTIGWPGLTFFANVYQIHGQSISADNLGVLMPVSFMEAEPSTRLFELWLEQKLWEGTVSIRFGQLSADSEFLIAEGGQDFLNGSWGWPAIAGLNLPDGGPAYPMAAPAVRVEIVPSDGVSFQTALFTGDPADDCAAGSPQVCNPNGLAFPFSDPLLFVEGAYNYNRGAGELEGTFKLGAWRLYSTFQPESVGSNALPVGLPAVPGVLAKHDYAAYAILDQMIYRLDSGDRNVAVFGRVIAAPSEGNMTSFYFDGGFTVNGPWPERPNDFFGIGLAYTGVSPKTSDYQRATGEPVIASYEAVLEVTYIAEILPGLSVQPDFQYFWNPGGHVADPDDPAEPVPNAVVLGLHTVIDY